MDDKDIIRLYLDRAEVAIGKTADKYGALCNRIASNILHNDEDAEECVNDAYFAVWNRIPPEEPHSLCAFIAKIVRNIALDRLDYNMAECRNGHFDMVLDEISEILPDIAAEEAFDSTEISRALNTFLESEKPRARVMFVRRYFYHDSMADIAIRMHMQENAVRASLFRTRKKLAIYLRKEGLGGIYVEKE